MNLLKDVDLESPVLRSALKTSTIIDYGERGSLVMNIKSVRKNIQKRLSCICKQSERGKIFAKNVRVIYSWNLLKMRWDNFLEFQFDESSYYIKEKDNIWKFVYTEKSTEYRELTFTDKTQALKYFENRVNGILNYYYLCST